MEVASIWCSPEELVTIGYQRTTVVMMNEAHNGLQRCIRTREIGRRILPTAHEAGVRHLAMEALWPYEFAEEANRTRTLPASPTEGYLAQPEMRFLIQEALYLGWMLIPYEADIMALPADPMEMESINWREEQQAHNIIEAVEALPAGTKLLVWCGNSHHSKHVSEWLPMGHWFRHLSGINHFGIDQCVTADLPSSSGTQSGPGLAKVFLMELAAFGGTAGFLTEEAPASFLRDREDQDAFILSTQNELV